MIKKYDGPTISTIRRISIVRSNDPENAENSIHVHWEVDSNEIDDNLQHEKHFELRFSTLAGIIIH
jgi:hypothetical protein